MSIKIIMVPFGGNSDSVTALNRAFVIARRFGAHIKGLHVMERMSDAVSFEFHLPAKLRGSVQASAEQTALARADEARAGFEAACQQASVTISDRPVQGDSPSASWHQEFGHVEDVLVRHAKTAAEVVRVGLTEMMINGVIDRRQNFLTRLAEVENLDTARVVRGPDVVKQYGPGFDYEKTKDDIERELRWVFDVTRECPGFVFATGNHFPANIPLDSALYYFDLVKQLGNRG